MVRHVAITVDTAPSGGTTLRDYVTGRLDPAAPAAARAVMGELVDATPATSADVDTRVSITFDPARANPRPTDLVSAVAEVTRWLPGLEASLAATGVAVLGRASVEWLIGRLRVAYDPASRGDVARVLDQHAGYPPRHAAPGYAGPGYAGAARRGRAAGVAGRRARCGPARPGTGGGTTRGCRCPGRWPRPPARRSCPGC